MGLFDDDHAAFEESMYWANEAREWEEYRQERYEEKMKRLEEQYDPETDSYSREYEVSLSPGFFVILGIILWFIF